VCIEKKKYIKAFIIAMSVVLYGLNLFLGYIKKKGKNCEKKIITAILKRLRRKISRIN